MASVTILDQVYTLPPLMTEQVENLWGQIQTRHQVIQEGLRPQPRLLGVIPRPGLKLDYEDRLAELAALIQDYHTILTALQARQKDYGDFFPELAGAVYHALLMKSATISQLEEERAALQEAAQAQRDAALQQWSLYSAEQLLRSLRLLGQATLLLGRQLRACRDLCSQLKKACDQQQQELHKVVSQLGNQHRAYTLQKRINRLAQLEAETTGTSVPFEHRLHEQLVPLQRVIAQSLGLAEQLRQNVFTIDAILQHMHQGGTTTFGEASEGDLRLIAFLTTFPLDRRRLGSLLERLERHHDEESALALELPPVTASSPAVLIALDNIQHLIELRLLPLVKSVVRPSSLPAPPVRALPAPAGVKTAMLETSSLIRSGITFVRIPAGEFVMGLEHGDQDERPPHRVRIHQPFYLSIYPITQRQWSTVMGDNSSYFPGQDSPVEQVSWEDVQLFIRRLNAQEGNTLYRLPTEAEWEYAARAGSTTLYCFGDDPAHLGDYAWYADNAQGMTHPVGQLQPNAWGLFDMHGNVWEWVYDWYGPYTHRAVLDPVGARNGSSRIIRGGSWVGDAWNCRSSYRDYVAPNNRGSDLGFRLVRFARD